ncbi:hypothetical protein [Nostoc sp.]|uniref:hypothetical protein n=1 Tax=Nostoc sp. TaxID=1180 RepID=UPI002FF6933E
MLGDAYGGKLRTSTTATIAYNSFRVTFHSQHHTHAENLTHYPTRDLSGALWK